MQLKIFRGTNSLEIGKMEVALNEWLKALPPGAAIEHTNTAYCSLDGVPSVMITVFWNADQPRLPAVATA
jgi:hypothetical protein